MQPQMTAMPALGPSLPATGMSRRQRFHAKALLVDVVNAYMEPYAAIFRPQEGVRPVTATADRPSAEGPGFAPLVGPGK
jgi:hypothetical protein